MIHQWRMLKLNIQLIILMRKVCKFEGMETKKIKVILKQIITCRTAIPVEILMFLAFVVQWFREVWITNEYYTIV